MIKHILKYSVLLLGALGLMCSCAKELDTDQYSSTEVRLVSFGPNPIMRGAPVRFFGSNLDRIVAVEVPGVGEISDIEVVESGRIGEIRVSLPVEGTLPGKLTLIDKDGKKYSTKDELTFTEPIVFDSFKTTEPAFPGQEISFSGDYMNLVKAVIFEGGSKVDVTPIDRHNAKAVIPADAHSGKVCLSDEGEIANLIYSEASLTMGEPTVSSVAVSPAKPGETLSIKGKFLNMIQSVVFEGGTEVTEFSVSADAKELTLALPATAQSGAVVANSFEGKAYTAGEITMVVPTALSADMPIKAGSDLVIKGKDLDIVTGVDFLGAEGAVFDYADNAITVNVPATAKEGDITLKMDNGDIVTLALTLVHPTVTAVAPTELMAGETITVTGTELDLITEASLGGKPLELGEQSETSLELKTANTSVSGKIVLKLSNGETVEPSDAITLSYDALIIVNEMPSAEHIGAEVTLKGSNFLMIESIYIGEQKVTSYTSRGDEQLSFIMPWNKIGSYPVKFVLTDGSEETCPNSIEVLNELSIQTIWEGKKDIAWTAMDNLAWGGFDWSTVKKGTLLNIYYTLDEDQTYWQMRPANGSWSALPSALELAPGEGNIPLDAGSTCLSIALTAADLDVLINQGGLVLTGTNYTLVKIELATLISQETTAWEGSEYSGEACSKNLELGESDYWFNQAIEEGTEIRVYFTADDPAEWKVQIFSGTWTHLFDYTQETHPDAAAKGYVSFIAEGDTFTTLTTQNWWGSTLILQGDKVTFTKIAYL